MFENYSKLTGPELTAFNKYLFKKNIVLYVALSVMLCLLGAFIIWVRVDVWDMVVGIVSIVLGVVAFPLLYLVWKYSIKKSIKKNEEMFSTNYIVHSTFNELNFTYEAIVDDKLISTTTLEYKNIYKIAEDNNYLFLLLNKVQALILDKNGFIGENLDSFKEFLSKKYIALHS